MGNPMRTRAWSMLPVCVLAFACSYDPTGTTTADTTTTGASTSDVTTTTVATTDAGSTSAALPGDATGAGDEVWIGCGFDDVESHDDVTYAWTAPQTGIYTLLVNGAGLSGIGVYRGHCNNPEDQVACGHTQAYCNVECG